MDYLRKWHEYVLRVERVERHDEIDGEGIVDTFMNIFPWFVVPHDHVPSVG